MSHPTRSAIRSATAGTSARPRRTRDHRTVRRPVRRPVREVPELIGPQVQPSRSRRSRTTAPARHDSSASCSRPPYRASGPAYLVRLRRLGQQRRATPRPATAAPARTPPSRARGPTPRPHSGRTLASSGAAPDSTSRVQRPATARRSPHRTSALIARQYLDGHATDLVVVHDAAEATRRTSGSRAPRIRRLGAAEPLRHP